MVEQYQSWGSYPKVKGQRVMEVYWPADIRRAWSSNSLTLPRGAGRSQGDVCLNDSGVLLDMRKMDRFISFDRETGLLTCEAGVTLAQLLQITLPHGWFLPVTPGTKYITVGGAIANDVHGKNHHREGTFGSHVRKLGLMRSTGEALECSDNQNGDLFKATIAGLGLTGVILWAQLQMKRVVSPLIDEEVIKMESIDDFFTLADRSDKDFEYTVAWLDCQTSGRHLGRGLFMRGNHSQTPADLSDTKTWATPKVTWPIDGPPGMINKWSVKAFNFMFYHKVLSKRSRRLVHFNKFFYPLDGVARWNRVYGQRGFLQYQFVVPREQAEEAVREVLSRIAKSGRGSFLSTMKFFGTAESPGILSFPRPGLVLAVDFISSDRQTRQLLADLDEIVKKHGGAVNPSKDSRMDQAMFAQSFPRLNEFRQYVDPKISSSFWRRVSQREEV